MKLLVIGENAVDIIIRADVDFSKEENVFPEEKLITPAGTGINFSVASLQLGLKPFYFCPISTDEFGSSILKYFKALNLQFFRAQSNKPTPLIITILNHEGVRNTIAMIKDTSYTDILFESFKEINREFDFAYISGGIITEKTPQIEVTKITKYLEKQGTFIFFDPQFRIGKGLEGFFECSTNLLDLSSMIFANENEFKEIPASSVQRKIDKGCVFVIKKGKLGASLISKSLNLYVEGLNVNAKDTTGAGDIFNAAFISKYVKGFKLYDCLEFANKVAALSTEKLGIAVPSTE